ncbi:hypothetical protein EYF80_059285 [Liparis tanakae]|uniref:Uncharacterized protein n=1 Tax=Liparis tanakae TaxID=230148 RepID=A0A4Z2EPS8_9TELE|nr:hypothetical protein EYF80_059285 [Liparis tanakae]
MARVFRAQGRPSPTRMSNTLLPMELDTAMSPIPGDGRDRGLELSGTVKYSRRHRGHARSHFSLLHAPAATQGNE